MLLSGGRQKKEAKLSWVCKEREERERERERGRESSASGLSKKNTSLKPLPGGWRGTGYDTLLQAVELKF